MTVDVGAQVREKASMLPDQRRRNQWLLIALRTSAKLSKVSFDGVGSEDDVKEKCDDRDKRAPSGNEQGVCKLGLWRGVGQGVEEGPPAVVGYVEHVLAHAGELWFKPAGNRSYTTAV